MPISQFLSDKWDEKLHNWLLWLGTGAGGSNGAKISSIYKPELSQRGTERTEGRNAVLSGDALDTDALMVAIQIKDNRMHDVLISWTLNDGTRGAQSNRLSLHPDTYKDIADSGKRELEQMSRRRNHGK